MYSSKSFLKYLKIPSNIIIMVSYCNKIHKTKNIQNPVRKNALGG